RAQTFDDVLQITRVLYRRRGDSDNLAANIRQFDRLLDRHRRVHRVASDHRLDANRIVSANPDIADADFARRATAIRKWRFAVFHNRKSKSGAPSAQSA